MAVPHKLLVVSDKNLGCHVQTGAVCIVLGDQRGRRAAVRGLRCLIPCLAPSNDSDVPPLQTAALTGDWAALGGASAFDSLLSKWCSGPSRAGDALRLAALASQAGDAGTFVCQGMLLAFPAGPLQVTVRSCCFVDAQGQRHPAVLLAPQQQGGTSALSPAVQHTTIIQATSSAPLASSLAVDGVACCVTVMQYPGRVLFQNSRSRAYYGDLLPPNQELHLPSTISQQAHAERPGASLPVAPQSHLQPDQPPPEGHVDGGTLLRLLLQGCVEGRGAGQGAFEDMLQALAWGQEYEAVCQMPATFDGIPELAALGLSLASHLTAPDTTMSHASLSAAVAAAAAAAAPASPLCGTPVRREGSSGALQLPIPLCGGGRGTNSARGSSLGRAAAGPHSDTPISVEEELLLLDLSIGGGSCKGGGAASKFGGGNGSSSGVRYGARRSVSLTSMHCAPLVASGQASPVVSGSEGLSSSGASRSVTPRPRSQVQAGGARPNGQPSLSTMVSTRSRLAIVQTGSLFGSSTPPDGDAASSLGYQQPSLAATATAAAAGLSPGPMPSSAASQVQDGLQKPPYGSSSWLAEELEQHVDAAQPPPAATLTPSLSSSTCRTATPVLPGPANSPACHPPLLPHATAVSASREPFPTEHVGAGTALGAQWHAPVHPSLGGLACVPSGSNALATETLQRLQAGVATAAAQRRRAVRRCTTTAALGASGTPGPGHSLAVGVDRESPRCALDRAGGRLEAVGGSGQRVALQLAAELTLRHQLQGEEAPAPWPQPGTEDDRTAPALPAATNSEFSGGEVALVVVSRAAEEQGSLEGRLRDGVAGLQQHDAPAARNGWMDTASSQRLETTSGGAGPAAGLVCSAAMQSVQHGPAAPPPARSCCVAGTRQQEDQPWQLQVHLAHKNVTQQDSTQGCGGLGQQLVHSSNVQGGQDAAGAGPVDSGNVRSAVQRIPQAGPPSAELGRGLAVISGLSFTDVCDHEADDDVNETYAWRAAAFAFKGDEHGGRGMGVEAVEDVDGFSGRLSTTRASLAAASGSTGHLGPIATAALGLARAAEDTTPAAARQGHGFWRQQRASSASGAARASSVSSSSGAATIAALVPAVAPSPIPSSPSRPPFPAHADMESATTPFAPFPQPFPPTASSDQHQGSLPVPVGLPGVSSPGASSSSSSSRTSVDPDALLLTSMQLSHAGTGATELTASLDVSALFTGALANTETHSRLSPFMATATTGAMFPERDACAAVRARAPRGEGEDAHVAAARAAAAGEACEPATKCAEDGLGALLALPRSSRGAAAEWSGGVPEAAAHILLHGGGVGLSDRQGWYAGTAACGEGQGSPAPGDCGPATESPFTLTHLLGGVDELQQVGSGGSGDRGGAQPGAGWNAEEEQVDEQVEVEVELAVGAEVLAAGGRATRAADEVGPQGGLAAEADGLAEAGGSATQGGRGQGVDSPQGDALAAAADVGQHQGQQGHQGVPMPLQNAGMVATSSGSWSDLSATAIRVMGFALPDSAPGPDNEGQVAEAVPQSHRAAANPPLSPLASTIIPYLPSRASASITFVPLPDPDGDTLMPSPTPLQQLAYARPSTTTTSPSCCSVDDSRPTVASCCAWPAAAAESQHPPAPLSKWPPPAPRAFGSTLLPTSSSALHASASNRTVASNAASSVHSATHMLSEGSNALFQDDAAAAIGQPVGFSDGYLAVFGASASNMATWRRGGGGAGGGARSPSGKRWMVQAAVEGMDEGGVEGEFGLGDRKSAVDGGTGARRRWQTQGQMADILEDEFGLGGANGCKYSSVGSILEGAHAGRRMHQKSGSAGTAASHVAMGTSPRPQGPGLGRVTTTIDRLRLLFSSLQQQQMQMQLQQQAQPQQKFQMQRPQPIQVPQQSLSRAVSGMRGSFGGASFSGRSTCASPASAGRGTPPTPRRAPWACHTLAGQPPSRPQSLSGAEAFGGELTAVPEERRSAAADSPSLWSCRAAAGTGTGTGMGKSLPGEQRQPPGCSATGGVVSAMAFAATATAPHTSSLHGTLHAMGPAAGAGAGAGAGPAASASAGAAAGAYMHQSSSQLTLLMMHGTATASSAGRTRWHKVVVVPCGVGPAGAAAGHGAAGSGGDGSGPVLTLAVTQIDVTEQVEAQEQLARLLEQEHKVLESIYPRHVIEYMTLQGVKQTGATCPGGGHGGVGGSLLSLCGGGDSVSRMASLATWHPGVTILFADIVGFTSMSSAAPPLAVMAFLNQLYSRFDGLVDIYKVYKVETIGDCYMVAGGLVACDEDGYRSVISGEEDPLHPVRVMEFAKAMLRAAREVRMPHTGEPVQLRIGLHSGPVTSGVVGDRMPRFCLFGDTVNVASRMESTCRPGAIHVSAATHARLQRESWLDRGLTAVKGKGDMRTYEWAGDADTPFDGGQLQRVIGLYL